MPTGSTKRYDSVPRDVLTLALGGFGLLQPPKKLFKIYDLTQLNSILRAEGKPEVTVKQVQIPAAESASTNAATTATTSVAK